MMPFDAYKCYLGMKNHFTKDNYDYIIPKKQNFKHHTQHKFESKLDQETKDQIYELFRDDFINFNYEK